jgi:hypothetical protein
LSTNCYAKQYLSDSFSLDNALSNAILAFELRALHLSHTPQPYFFFSLVILQVGSLFIYFFGLGLSSSHNPPLSMASHIAGITIVTTMPSFFVEMGVLLIFTPPGLELGSS